MKEYGFDIAQLVLMRVQNLGYQVYKIKENAFSKINAHLSCIVGASLIPGTSIGTLFRRAECGLMKL